LADLSDETKELKLYLFMMKERIKEMEGYVTELTDYSRNTRLEVILKSHSVAKIVNEVLENLSFYEAAQHINLILKIDPKLVVNTDSNRLKVILNNLVYNAYKYYNKDIESPFIAIRAKCLEGIVQIAGEDNGIRIDDEYHETIFDMFCLATENSEGSGLGLYIVKETLEKIGGTISVSSAKGKGSTFFVMLGQLSITLTSPL
jgi:signal transduction histidine kinase